MWFIRYCESLEGTLRDAGSSYSTLDLCEPRFRADALQTVLECRNRRVCPHGKDLVFDKVLRQLTSDLNDSVRFKSYLCSNENAHRFDGIEIPAVGHRGSPM